MPSEMISEDAQTYWLIGITITLFIMFVMYKSSNRSAGTDAASFERRMQTDEESDPNKILFARAIR